MAIKKFKAKSFDVPINHHLSNLFDSDWQAPLLTFGVMQSYAWHGLIWFTDGLNNDLCRLGV